MGIDYSQKIPNNVDLSNDRKLQRALEKWQPKFLDWWSDMGPEGFMADDVYLRTAVSVERDGWAHFGHVKMPDYRWGIFLSEPQKDRPIYFGDHMGKPAWQTVPGEYRNMLRRIIVTQGDTEPASVEQQRALGHTAPSLYDLRNLFQVNVEEGRHLWAMVYLLQAYFGRDGREEAEELLERRAGNEDKPRILDAFNQPCTDWLTFFCFTTFTDRDGKYQLASLAESAFDPLSRTCRFMLTEEAHHMFVGETGMARIMERSLELERVDPNGDVRNQGGIDMPTIQKYVNYWFAYSLDLFGSEISSNAADYFASGIKGRFHEGGRTYGIYEPEKSDYTDHLCLDAYKAITVIRDGKLANEDVPLRNAMNEDLREQYARDCHKAVERWNKRLAKLGTETRITLPHIRFFRRQGIYAGTHFNLEGDIISAEQFEAKKDDWLPTDADRAYVQSLMGRAIVEPGKMAHWIAPPRKGINAQPEEFEYVRFQ